MCSAQSPSDSIYVKKSFWGYKFYQGNYRYNFNQLPELVQSDANASDLMKKAKTNATISAVVGGVGGFLVAWQLGTAIVGGDPNWAVAGVGGGLIIISMPIHSKANRQAVQAVEIFNNSLTTNRQKPVLILGFAGNGLGLRMTL